MVQRYVETVQTDEGEIAVDVLVNRRFTDYFCGAPVASESADGFCSALRYMAAEGKQWEIRKIATSDFPDITHRYCIIGVQMHASLIPDMLPEAPEHIRSIRE